MSENILAIDEFSATKMTRSSASIMLKSLIARPTPLRILRSIFARSGAASALLSISRVFALIKLLAPESRRKQHQQGENFEAPKQHGDT